MKHFRWGNLRNCGTCVHPARPDESCPLVLFHPNAAQVRSCSCRRRRDQNRRPMFRLDRLLAAGSWCKKRARTTKARVSPGQEASLELPRKIVARLIDSGQHSEVNFQTESRQNVLSKRTEV